MKHRLTQFTALFVQRHLYREIDMAKPFFYRMDAAEFLAIALSFSSDKERGKFMNQLALDLVTGNGTTSYAKKLISEVTGYIEKKKSAGSKGGKQRVSNAQAVLKQNSSITQASSSSSSSSSTVTEAVQEAKTKNQKPLSEYSDDFETFWTQYPDKTGKGKAYESWCKKRPPLMDVLNALIWQKKSKKWIEGFIPLPATYLNQRRWHDEPEKATMTASKGAMGAMARAAALRAEQELGGLYEIPAQ
jgi:hypothetical protein